MAPRDPTLKWAGFEVALVGEGVSPSEVSARKLAQLLEAACAFFDEVARDQGWKVAAPSLVEVRTGSAAYAFRSRDPQAGVVCQAMDKHARDRGRDAAPSVRRALRRMYDVGTQVAAVRFALLRGSRRLSSVVLAAPEMDDSVSIEEVRDVFGLVAGVTAGLRKGATVHLRIDDGAVSEFEADLSVAERAAELFMKPARARVTYETGARGDVEGQIESIDAWDRDERAMADPLVAFDRARDALRAAGLKVRAADWLRSLDDDEG